MRKRIAAVAAGMAALAALAGCGADPLTIRGTMTVPGASQTNTEGEPCAYVEPGLEDISKGTRVTVRDADGTIVATGALGGGTYVAPGAATHVNTNGWCRFPFTIDEVRPDSSHYTIEAGRRGEVVVEKERLLNGGEVRLSLGLNP